MVLNKNILFRFTPEGTALQSVYEAFRFTESYGVIFQCNVKYCLGPCEPVRKKIKFRFLKFFMFSKTNAKIQILKGY